MRGFTRGGTAVFLGIPFAQAPIGPLRFAAPEPVEPWEGELDASTYGATAARRARGFGAPASIPPVVADAYAAVAPLV